MPGIPLPFNQTLGETIPPGTSHTVSVSLPTWESNVAYEMGEKWVTDKMKCGYPRFFIHPIIDKLAQNIVKIHGSPDDEKAMLCPSHACAMRLVEFLLEQNSGTDPSTVREIDFVADPEKVPHDGSKRVMPRVSAVIYPKDLWPTAKIFWQHTGEGISSRRAEFCQRFLDDRALVDRTSISSKPVRMAKGPRRYQRPMSINHGAPNGLTHNGNETDEDTSPEGGNLSDFAQFVEERFGRNLDVTFAAQAKQAIRRRIAGSLTTTVDLPEALEQPSDMDRERSRHVPGFSADDVYLHSCGMNAIFTAHRAMRIARGEMKSIMYGFPYVDTLKILEKWGPGAVFYGHCSAEELDDLERRLEGGERYLALFCECPGNPLLKTPNLKRIRALADKYDFAVVIDETIGNFLNIHVLAYADVLVSSLTKIFSGDGNVMGGAMVLNPSSRYYGELRAVLDQEYEDLQFEEDSVYLERNSRDFVSRIQRINHNAEVIAGILRAHPKVKQVNYPKYSDTKQFYDEVRAHDGGYGGLLSATFHSTEDAEVFYDNLDSQKGPSLGTNFTLSSPFVLLAHFNELDWAAQFGCEVSLIRFSVGLEDTDALRRNFERALAAIGE